MSISITNSAPKAETLRRNLAASETTDVKNSPVDFSTAGTATKAKAKAKEINESSEMTAFILSKLSDNNWCQASENKNSNDNDTSRIASTSASASRSASTSASASQSASTSVSASQSANNTTVHIQHSLEAAIISAELLEATNNYSNQNNSRNIQLQSVSMDMQKVSSEQEVSAAVSDLSGAVVNGGMSVAASVHSFSSNKKITKEINTSLDKNMKPSSTRQLDVREENLNKSKEIFNHKKTANNETLPAHVREKAREDARFMENDIESHTLETDRDMMESKYAHDKLMNNAEVKRARTQATGSVINTMGAVTQAGTHVNAAEQRAEARISSADAELLTATAANADHTSKNTRSAGDELSKVAREIMHNNNDTVSEIANHL